MVNKIDYVYILKPVNEQDANEFDTFVFRDKESIINYCNSLDDVTNAYVHEEFDYCLIVCWKDQEEIEGYSISDYYINKIKLI